MTSLTIPNSVEQIGKYTFQSCLSLKDITLGESLLSIGAYTFKNCSEITKIESMNPTAPTITETVFPTTVYETAQLVVPLGAEESYQSATGWSKFTNTSAGYKVTVDYSSMGGSVAVNDSIASSMAIDFDTKVDFVITPNEGFEIEKVTLNEEDITESVVDGKYSLEKLTEDVTFAVTFRKLYTITTVFNSEEGIVKINDMEEDSVLVSFDSKVDFIITPNEGYEIDKVLLNEIDITADVVEGKYSIEKASEDVTLNVSFRKLLVIGATFNNEEGCVTINGEEVNPILVSTGSKLDFVITPNIGYEIDKVTLNDEDITAEIADGKYTIDNATGNVKISVTFKVKTFALTLKCSEAGAFEKIMKYGETETLKIVPSENWSINTVVFNGTDVTADVIDGAFTTPAITENSELYVVFMDIATSVYSVYNTSDVKVYASQQTISIKGLEDNTPVAVYSTSGQMEYSKIATDYEMDINMNKNGVYLVKVGERTFKVML